MGGLAGGYGFAAAVFGLGYLLGSIPFGLVLTRAAGLGDIRKIGSGNIGATNVLRTGHKGLALLTLLLDGGKGAAAVLAASALGPADGAVAAAAAGLGAVLGHLFPVWLRGRGGKGVATSLGALAALAPPAGIGAALVWLAVAGFSRFSSLAALAALASAPVLGWLWAGWPGLAFALPTAAAVWWRHRANIRRLLDGSEPRIGRRAEPD